VHLVGFIIRRYFGSFIKASSGCRFTPKTTGHKIRVAGQDPNGNVTE